MSAPLVVNTKDGVCWTRRQVTSGGIALYAPERVKTCPDFVMATLEELAEQGIVGSAFALPVPVGPEPQASHDDRAKAPWGRGEDGRPLLPLGAHWTDVPELVDRTVSGIQARVDQAQSGHWYDASATETWRAPGTVCTRVDGYHRTVGRFTNVLPADLELVLHAHSDLSWCLEMLAKFRARVAELESLTAQTTEFRLWEPGYGLYVRRAPGATGFGVLEARRTDKGRRCWTTAGWQYSAVLSDTELFCWPDAETAVAEARRVMPGAVVREENAAEDIVHPCGCPKRFDRHAWGCPTLADEELRSCCAGPVCTCTPSSPQDDEHIPTGKDTPAPTPMTVYLSTPCDACRHTLNWHRNDVGCTVALCVCGRFQEPTETGGDV